MTDLKTNQCDPTQAGADNELWRLRGTVVDGIAEFGIDHDLTRRSKTFLLEAIYAARADVLTGAKPSDSDQFESIQDYSNDPPDVRPPNEYYLLWRDLTRAPYTGRGRALDVQRAQAAANAIADLTNRLHAALAVVPYRSDADLLAGRPHHEGP